MRGVLFDLDGTLVDSRRDLAAAANAVLNDLDLPTLPLEVVASYVGNGARTLIARCLNHVAPGREADEDIAHAFLAHYDRVLLDTTAAFPGVEEGLELLHSQGVPMGVVTNKPHEPAVDVLDALDLSRFFGIILGSGAVPAKKPAPDGLLIAAGKIGVRPPSCIYVGDSDVDVGAARAAGMTAVWCSWGGFQLDAPADADRQIHQFSEVADLVAS
ncbi:MAG: phosphoglycolate phosphatase [Proteobacteria bacterium]|nr:phosphoglycolate phosphatase [Pseudomonadota bacterium]